MQFADGVTDAEASDDGVATVDAAVARARLFVLLGALMADFEGSDGSLLDDPSGWPEGVEEAPP